MELRILKPRKALNKAFLKVKPNRTEIECFKTNLIELLDRINDKESEEFHKNLVSDFLKDTYYKQNHFINTKGRNDLVIHNTNSASSPVGVIIEAKKPTQKSEMLSLDKINVKAFQELVLYYLRERITHKNIEVKYLIATNINQWFIFDATLFDRLFAQNKTLVKQFVDFEEGRLAEIKTDFFYKQIAEPFIADIKHDIEFTYFDIREYEKPLRNNDQKDDNKLISLFKLLSPEHLLKLPFANDSNSLDKRFYGELLHIIGLIETKEGSKKLIERNKEGERNTGSFIENAIIQLESLDKISRLENASQFGSNLQEKLFNVGLELSITWINRILFLKLLEAQLITYHKGDKSYEFLSFDKIKDYDDLNSLFFQVLARKQNERNEDIKALFAKVPYLNSSLFEPTEIEHSTLFISQLHDDKTLPIYSQTVLKDTSGKKRTGNFNPLEYLFEFLNAYDFASEGSEEIQEDNKTLINASVLGLIFEKINGYKDGSFFTPGFITMYMCRETIRKAVVQKFNETKKWNCTDIHSLYDKIEDRNEANKIINDLKICDPAVGSGHFLVSALNEMIAIKSDLKILQDREGKRLKEYHFEVVNDELIVTDEDGELFEYNPTNKESQRIQETLFHEKQTIIENCLFGVDINPNSVKICRLRLWIELLKNAYYKNATELETLPNIDINIKCGNSLVSRFAIDSDLKLALKKSKWTINTYKIAVSSYRNAKSKEEKRDLEKLILKIKNDFTFEIHRTNPLKVRLDKLLYQLNNRFTGIFIFEPDTPYSKNEKELELKGRKEKEEIESEINSLTKKLKEIQDNKIYQNAFEWRFEFPEVLNDDGDFVGFDVVIGNPPYGMIQNDGNYFLNVYKTMEGRFDLFEAFIERALLIVKQKSIVKYILPNTLLTNLYSKKVRKNLLDNYNIVELTNFGMNIFEEATVHTCIIGIQNSIEKGFTEIRKQVWSKEELNLKAEKIKLEDILDKTSLAINVTLSTPEIKLFSKISQHKTLSEICYIRQCIKTGDDKKYVTKSENNLLEPWKKSLRGKGIERYNIIEEDIYIKYGDFLARNWQNKLFYETPKIAIRETGNRIIAALDLDNRYFLSTLYAIYPKTEFETDYLKYLLGILNSNLATFFIKKIAFDLTEGAFTKVRTNQLGRLPIPSYEKSISTIVDKIIMKKQQNKDTNNEEQQIDQLVYQLYDLTEEEIKIVEGIK